MRINKTILLVTLIFQSSTVFAVCVTPPNQEKTLEYYGCLQNELIEAQYKANIKGENDKINRVEQHNGGLPTPGQSMPGQALFNGIEIPTNPNPKSAETPKIDISLAYVGYSSSSIGTEAIIAYGNSKSRVKPGSLLADGWSVKNITNHELTVTKEGKTKRIPLLTGAN